MNQRRLARSDTDRRIGGVAGGIAEYFDIDPLLIRIGFVIASLMGWGLLAYLILWLAIPSASAVGGGAGGGSPAIRIAEERYARGEIGPDDLERIRADLTSA